RTSGSRTSSSRPRGPRSSPSHVRDGVRPRRIDAVEVAKVGVVGLGTMGAGIAQLCVEAGFETVGREPKLARAEQARERNGHFLRRKVEKGQLEAGADEKALARLALTDDVADLAGCDLVIEAAFEDLEVKQGLFRELEAAVRDDAI